MGCHSPEQYNQLDIIENFESEWIPSRTIRIWKPPYYDDSKDYPVIYMHDGQMLFDSTTTWNGQEWKVDEVMNQLIKSDKILPSIIVGIDHTEKRHGEYFPQKVFNHIDSNFIDTLSNELQSRLKNIVSDNYLKFIIKDLKPFVDKNYRTNPSVDKTYIMGSSMGGLISMYALCEYPDIFGGAACLSTHWPGIFTNENNPIPQHFIHYFDQHIDQLKDKKIYFDLGTETLDTLYEAHQVKVDSILEIKYPNSKNWLSKSFEGAKHDERSWAKRLHIPIEFLLPK